MARGRARAEWAHTSSLMAQLVNVNRIRGRAAKPQDFNPMIPKKQAPPMNARELTETLGALMGVRRLDNG